MSITCQIISKSSVLVHLLEEALPQIKFIQEKTQNPPLLILDTRTTGISDELLNSSAITIAITNGFEETFPPNIKTYAAPFSLQDLCQFLEMRVSHPETICLGAFTLHTYTKQLEFSSAVVDLTEKEMVVLSHFMKSPNTKFPRNTLLKEVWKISEDTETHTLETHIYTLRKKISELTKHKSIPLNFQEEGYIWED